MGFFDWLRFRRPKPLQVLSEAKCAFCADPIKVKDLLEDLGVPGPKDCYLLRCPKCGQCFGGYGYTPQCLWELSAEEVARYFPGGFLA